MPTAESIKTYSRVQLKRLWQQLRTGADGGFASGKAFEFLIIRGFELDGATVEWPFTVPMAIGGGAEHQIDGVVLLPGVAALVESKHWNDAVDFAPIAKLLAHLRRRPPASMGVIFGAKGFTVPARQSLILSAPSQVLLWDGDEVDWAFERAGRFVSGLESKYRQAVKTGLPDFHLKAGEGQ